MKKTVISLLLVVAMVLSFVLVAAPSAEAVTEQQHPHSASTSHCTCGEPLGSCTGKYPGHTTLTENSNIQWKPFPNTYTKPSGTGTEAVATGLEEGGYYYLTSDVATYTKEDGSACTRVKIDTAITLCLNGYTFNNTIHAYKNLTITDCSATPGKVTSTTTSYGNGGLQGGIIHVRGDGATFNLFNATLEYAGNGVRYGGVVSVNCTSGNKESTFNMYSGTLTGGIAGGTGYGGTVFIGNSAKCRFNLYGGDVMGGTANYGGAIYVSDAGILNIQGGTIYSGISNTSGGSAIYTVSEAPSITYGGGTIIAGSSAKSVISYKDAGTVSLGITKMGLEIAEDGSVGVGYITGYTMTDGMKAKLTASASLNNTAYGLKLWTEGGTPVYAGYNDKNATAVGAHLRNIMNGGNDDAANAVVPVKGAAYAFIGGTIVESATQSFTLQNLVEKMDAKLTDDTALAVLKDLYKLYESVMSGWTLSKINAA